MRTGIDQRAPGLLPPVAAPAGPIGLGARAHAESLVRGFEVLAQRIAELDDIPLDLLERHARSLNAAERSALARVKLYEETH